LCNQCIASCTQSNTITWQFANVQRLIGKPSFEHIEVKSGPG